MTILSCLEINTKYLKGHKKGGVKPLLVNIQVVGFLHLGHHRHRGLQ
jgi:hypothetical protein